jgi:hypothetical protein
VNEGIGVFGQIEWRTGRMSDKKIAMAVEAFLTKLRVVQVYGGYYLAPSPKGFTSEESAKNALVWVKGAK